MRASWNLVFVLALLATDCCASECKNNEAMHHYYTELACLPVYRNAASNICPSEYDCTETLANLAKGKCYVDGKLYEQGTVVETTCNGEDCVCEGGEINCNAMLVDCPINWEDGHKNGCEWKYEKGACCPDLFCHNASELAANTCYHAGKTYNLSDYIQSEETFCKHCFCRKGYDGTLNGPWCSEIGCKFLYFHAGDVNEGCAPVFRRTPPSCCPNSWRCPNSTDTVVPAASPKPASSGKCTFGSLTLNVGDALSPALTGSVTCAECACVVPPHVTCVQEGYVCSK